MSRQQPGHTMHGAVVKPHPFLLTCHLTRRFCFKVPGSSTGQFVDTALIAEFAHLVCAFGFSRYLTGLNRCNGHHDDLRFFGVSVRQIIFFTSVVLWIQAAGYSIGIIICIVCNRLQDQLITSFDFILVIVRTGGNFTGPSFYGGF